MAERLPGISAFMRIRNGEAFLEATIRSHIDCFDEIVAVHNQCTDRSVEILENLKSEFGEEKLRVIHYVDRVYPPGSTGHIETPGDSPNSLVNYYNFSLAATRYQVATKLDDDHLAIGSALKKATDSIRKLGTSFNEMHCFSGPNLLLNKSGELSVPLDDPISGGGDIGFFPVSENTYFTHDRRFERFHRGNLTRKFVGFLYWHLKYLKPDHGFGNYELDQNPNSRYAKRLKTVISDRASALQVAELQRCVSPSAWRRFRATLSSKDRLQNDRDSAILGSFSDVSIDEAVKASADWKLVTD
ncbi:glycosyl transferase [Rhodopirellula sp. JC740]|uniref:Glycosyl transferase n=1 Tax=Rhodopirellula halodulae TaxID=2894198 RepID=A0ABS8NJI6_9BACT|nr:glycosyl transferase [Rhodopirellula sp. JC740]